MVNYPLWLEQTSNSSEFKAGENLTTRYEPPNNQFWLNSKSLWLHFDFFLGTDFSWFFQQESNKWQKLIC